MGLAECVGLALVTAHFLVPAVYYAAAKRWLAIPLESGEVVEPPRVTVVIPTYNEAKMIVEKLDDVIQQDYPRERLEIIVVDSGSTDGTVDKAREWARRRGVEIKIIEEGARRGKAHALNTALRYATGDVIVITDADSRWRRDALRKAVAYLMRNDVGAVSCNKTPLGGPAIEKTYRSHYQLLRIAESKKWSTPIFHGELAAYKKDLLTKIGGFPTDIGADDSYTAIQTALTGQRAIIPEDVHCTEYVPRKEYWRWRIRRAQHLIQSFAKAVRRGNPPKHYKPILYTEAYLHLANPWLLIIGATILLATATQGALTSAAILAAGAALLTNSLFRTWITTQIILATASIKNLWNKEVIWKKEEKL